MKNRSNPSNCAVGRCRDASVVTNEQGRWPSRFGTLKRAAHYLILNLRHAVGLTDFRAARLHGILLRGLEATELCTIQKICASAGYPRALSLHRRILYFLLGRKLALVAEDPDGTLVGVVLYYFNPRDIEERTIHEGLICVIPSRQGQGIGKAMRTYALQHFDARHGLGMSSIVAVDNLRSLRPLLSMGFVVRKPSASAIADEPYYLSFHSHVGCIA